MVAEPQEVRAGAENRLPDVRVECRELGGERVAGVGTPERRVQRDLAAGAAYGPGDARPLGGVGPCRATVVRIGVAADEKDR